MSDEAKRVLIGVGGGVAAYKAVAVASKLAQAGHRVQVQLTPAATRFVTPLSFAAVTGVAARSDMWDSGEGQAREQLYPHLYPATGADAMVVLPATANLIARLAHGLADDLVTTSAVSLPRSCRRWFCPAMNVEMWHQPVVQENVHRLEDLGWQRLGPAGGHLACGMEGAGRMSEPADILSAVQAQLAAAPLLVGRKVLITSGPTVEHVDPVRFISNHSSGLMGKAIAEAAVAAGASVQFVTGPVPEANLPRGPGIEITPIGSADELLAACRARFAEVDAAVFAAAVADYAPTEVAAGKGPKAEQGLTLSLRPTVDIAATLGGQKQPRQVLIGFALETDNGPTKARAKLQRKHLDGIVLNSPDSFGASTGAFTYITAEGQVQWGRVPKTTCATKLVQALADARPSR